MAKMSTMSTILRDLDERQLRSLVRAKRYQVRLEKLESDIRSLEAELQNKERERAKLAAKLAGITDGSTRGKPGPKKRRTSTLAEAIVAVLDGRGPLGLTEIARALLDAGYRTSSSFGTFRTSVAHGLRKLRSQLRKSDAGYALMNSARKEEPGGKSGKRRRRRMKNASRKDTSKKQPEKEGASSE
jgi:hypothetical protein